jgi:hypothetical protein
VSARACPAMARRHTRSLIRTLTGAVLCIALVTGTTAPVPEDLPALAVQQPGLYRLEVTLLVFYGALLLITPAVSGLLHGRLPIEISTRGAKFAEGSDRWVDLDETAIRKLEEKTADLTQALANALVEIERLDGIANSDTTQRRVDSKR